jgi:hypothetical protein
MILTKSPNFLHDSTEPTSWSARMLRFFRRFSPLFSPPFGKATGSFNGLHPQGYFLALRHLPVPQLGAIPMAVLLSVVSSDAAGIINGDFEAGSLAGWSVGGGVTSPNCASTQVVGLGMEGYFGGELTVLATAYSYTDPPESHAAAVASLEQSFDGLAGQQLSLWVRPWITTWSFVGGPHSANISATVILTDVLNQVVWQTSPDMGVPGGGVPDWTPLTSDPLPADGAYTLWIGISADATLVDPPSYEFDAVNIGGTMNVDQVRFIPEPSVIMLLAASTLGLVRRRSAR